VAELAGVGPTTVKQVKKVKKEAPDKFEEIAQGKTTAKKALKGIKKTPKKGANAASTSEQDPIGTTLNQGKGLGSVPDVQTSSCPQVKERPVFKVGDVLYVLTTRYGRAPTITQLKVKRIDKDDYICTDGRSGKGKRVLKHQAETLETAKLEWESSVKELIEDKQQKWKS